MRGRTGAAFLLLIGSTLAPCVRALATDCNDNGVDDALELRGHSYAAAAVDLGDLGAPLDSATGDFDGDGDADLAAVGPMGLAVTLNDGKGSFQPGVGVPGAHLSHVIAIDVDGDQHLDLAALGADSALVTIFKNDGAAHFSPGPGFDTGLPYGSALATGDLDGDGDPDVVAVTRDARDPVILWNDGAGGFGERKPLPLERQQQDVWVGLIDDDELPDIAILAYGIAVFLNEGAGEFLAQPLLRDADYSAKAIALGDMNGDSLSDLVTVGLDARVYLATSPGTWGKPSISPIWEESGRFALADVDSDGDSDVVLPHRGDFGELYGRLSIIWNDGGGRLQQEMGVLVGDGPSSVQAFDVDQDGDLDLLTTNIGSGDASLVRNSLPSELTALSYVTVERRARSVAIADFDGDGRGDLAVSHDGFVGLSILWNRGRGRFERTTDFLVGAPAGQGVLESQVYAFDMNGDTLVDLVTSAQVLLNQGSGTFAPSPGAFESFMGFGSHRPLSFSDIEQDGDLDIAGIGVNSQRVLIARNDGHAVFQLAAELIEVGDVYSVAMADWNRDGWPDVASGLDRKVAIHVGRPDGTFEEPVLHSVPGAISNLLIVDLDEDGRLDLVGVGGEGLPILWGLGDGSFESPRSLPFKGEQLIPYDDLNDGRMNLAVTTKEGLQIIENKGDRVFEAGRLQGVGKKPFAVQRGWINQDSRPDLAVTDFDGGFVSILYEGRAAAPDCNGNGVPDECDSASDDCNGNSIPDTCELEIRSIDLGPGRLFDARGSNLRAVSPGDLDGDGDLDLLVGASSGFDSVGLFSNDGAGGLRFESSAFYRGLLDARLADLDGNGELDIVVSAADPHPTDPFTPQSSLVHILLRQGGWTVPAPASYPVGRFPTRVLALDIDGDNDLDLVTGNQVTEADLASGDAALKDITILRNNGSGSFELAGGALVGGSVADMAMGDLDGDSDLDLLILSGIRGGDWMLGQVQALYNGGDGSFGEPTLICSGTRLGGVAAGDLDGDGDLDVAVAGESDVTVYFNRDERSFEAGPASTDEALLNTRRLLASDLDGDGDLDLVAGQVSALENDGEGRFTVIPGAPGGLLMSTMQAADLDGDRRPDLVGAIFSTRNIIVIPNRTPRFREPDCNANGILDDCEADSDLDGVNDDCDLCPGQDDRLDADGDGQPECLVTPLRALALGGGFRPFSRGDGDQDGRLGMSDAITGLRYLFSGDARPGCLRSLDANDDSALDLTDAVYILRYLFLGTGAPPPPFPECGLDLEADPLTCEVFVGCSRL